jgi:hypothetical protein
VSTKPPSRVLRTTSAALESDAARSRGGNRIRLRHEGNVLGVPSYEVPQGKSGVWQQFEVVIALSFYRMIH